LGLRLDRLIDALIDGLGILQGRGALALAVGGVGQPLALVKQSDAAIERLTDSDFGVAQAAGAVLRLHLVERALVLEGEVLREGACALPPQDEGPLRGAVQHGAVRIMRRAGTDRKAVGDGCCGFPGAGIPTPVSPRAGHCAAAA
jgi:hypothetical protein